MLARQIVPEMDIRVVGELPRKSAFYGFDAAKRVATARQKSVLPILGSS